MSNSQDLMQQFDRVVMPTYARRPLALVRGRGTKVWDADGKVYLDFVAGIAVINLGHGHPAVVEAVRRQADILTHVSNLYYTEPQGRLAETLAGLAGGGKCFFCNSGAEANETLIKMARRYGAARHRFEIITLRGGFHGRTLATLAATGQARLQQGFEPMPTGFVHADYNDLDAVKAAVTPRTTAILVEAVQGEGGVIPATPAFLQGLRQLCDDQDLLLLCDEVQCGMGRTGKWFAFQHADIAPDAFSLAKALGNGFPIGAVVAAPKVADVLTPGSHASTFGGSPLACAAAQSVLDTIAQENLLQHASDMGARLRKGLEALAGKYNQAGQVKAVRGLGLMLGLVLDRPARPLEERLLDAGLISLTTADQVLRFLPPLTVKIQEVDEALDILDECCADIFGVAPAAEPDPEPTPAMDPPAPAEADPADGAAAPPSA